MFRGVEKWFRGVNGMFRGANGMFIRCNNRIFRGANRMFTCERCRLPPKGRPGETLSYNGVLGGNRVCLEGV